MGAITEPTKAEWRSSGLVVRVDAGEMFTFGALPDALITIDPTRVQTLVLMLTNALAWLDRRIKQEEDAS